MVELVANQKGEEDEYGTVVEDEICRIPGSVERRITAKFRSVSAVRSELCGPSLT
jgi:hypothetical protein